MCCRWFQSVAYLYVLCVVQERKDRQTVVEGGWVGTYRHASTSSLPPDRSLGVICRRSSITERACASRDGAWCWQGWLGFGRFYPSQLTLPANNKKKDSSTMLPSPGRNRHYTCITEVARHSKNAKSRTQDTKDNDSLITMIRRSRQRAVRITWAGPMLST